MEKNKPIFSTAHVVKLLIKKSTLIICLAIIAAVVGGVAGALLGIKDHVYGSTVDFYLTQTDPKGDLLPLLRSEVFAEKLLLDEYGLPAELAGTEEYENAKQEVIKFNEAREAFKNTAKLRKLIRTSLTTPKDANGNTLSSWVAIDQTYNTLKSNYESLSNLLTTYKNAQTNGIVTSEHLLKTQELEVLVDAARAELEQYRDLAHEPARIEINLVEDQYTIDKNNVENQREASANAVEKVVAEWRSDPSVQKKVSTIAKSITIENATLSNISDSAKPTTPESSSSVSFIRVNVTVEEDSALANLIIENLKSKLPTFVEAELERIADVPDASCVLISPARKAEQLNESDLVGSIIPFAVVAAVLVAVLTGALIVLKDWLRLNTEEDEKSDKGKAEKAQSVSQEANS